MAIEYQCIRVFFGNSGLFALTPVGVASRSLSVIKLPLFLDGPEVMDEGTYRSDG